ncbi:hypothetical protein D3C85_1750610 [compost metagenome]
MAARVFGDVDVIEDPYALERQGRKARIQLAKAQQPVVLIIGQGQVDDRLLASQTLFQKGPGGVWIGERAIELAVFDEQRRQ